MIAFHLWLEPNPSPMALVAIMSAALAYLTAKNWSVYRPILAMWPSKPN